MSIPSVPLVTINTVFKFHTWEGWISDTQNIVDVFHRPGDTTAGFQTLGTRGRVATCRACTFFNAQTDAVAFANDVEQLQGTGQEMITQWGENFDVIIHSVKAVPKHTRGEARFRVECEITLEIVTNL